MSNDYRKTPEALSRLTSLQYRVTQEDSAEPSFRNEYWSNHEPGIYVDVVSGVHPGQYVLCDSPGAER